MKRSVLLALLPLLVACQEQKAAKQDLVRPAEHVRTEPCKARDLRVTAGEIDAGMGHRHLPVEVTLKGSGPCELGAWPDIVLTSKSRAGGIAVERQQAQGVAVSSLVLDADSRASFVLGWSVMPVEFEGETECASFDGWMLRRSDASETPRLEAPIQACGRKITVSPFLLQARNGDAAAKPS